MHDKYMVGLTFRICAVHDLRIYTDRGNTVFQGSAEQFIDSLVLTVNACSSPHKYPIFRITFSELNPSLDFLILLI